MESYMNWRMLDPALPWHFHFCHWWIPNYQTSGGITPHYGRASKTHSQRAWKVPCSSIDPLRVSLFSLFPGRAICQPRPCETMPMAEAPGPAEHPSDCTGRYIPKPPTAITASLVCWVGFRHHFKKIAWGQKGRLVLLKTGKTTAVIFLPINLISLIAAGFRVPQDSQELHKQWKLAVIKLDFHSYIQMLANISCLRLSTFIVKHIRSASRTEGQILISYSIIKCWEIF